MRRLITSSVVVAAGVGLALALSVGASGRPSIPPTGLPSQPVHATTSHNKTLAKADATKLLSKLRLPAGAVRVAHAPRGVDLTVPFQQLTPNLVDVHKWWLVPGSPSVVLAYVLAHPPTGSAQTMSAAAGASVEAYGFTWADVPGVLSQRMLGVQAAPAPNQSTAVRADGEDIWIRPRPKSERIPAGVGFVRVTATDEAIKQGPFTSSSTATIKRVVALVNALPLFPPGAFACPADWGSVTISFYRVSGGGNAPLAVATADNGGCGGVELTIAGHHEPALQQTPRFFDQLGSALGVEIDTRPPK
jgi:hypothetical protein